MTDRPTLLMPAPEGYTDWLAELKTRIHSAQQRAALAVNRELVLLYWHIGRDILDRQSREGWGAKVVDRLSRDLREAFPQMKGFSSRNLKYMRFFAEHCPSQQFGQQPAAQLPWFHIVTLLTQLQTPEEREWYAAQALQRGWSRTTLEVQIKNRLLARQGQAVTNFGERLPSPHSDLAQDTLKDPYLFDFLGLGDEAHERDIESGLIRHITHFLLELGTGFAFGRSMAQVVEKLRPYLLGWKAYFGMAQTPKVWRGLDEWLRHRLRAIQLRHWKRPKAIYRELKALGASEDVANQVAGNCHRWWRNSDGAIKRVLTIGYFDRLGVPRLS